MSFVEGLSVVGAEVADPAFALCVGAIALLVGLLLAVPALATALRYLSADSAKLVWRFIVCHTTLRPK